MERKEIQDFFCGILKNEEDVSAGVAAIRTLFKVLEHYKSETDQELNSNLQSAIEVMRNTDYPVTAIVSGCELFRRFITLAQLDTKTFAECKQIMLQRGMIFVKKLEKARGKIVKLASQFIIDGSRILTHSRSRVVLHTLTEAARMGKRFVVYVTKSAPDNSGLDTIRYNFTWCLAGGNLTIERMCKDLTAEHIPCTFILDSAVGYVMEQIDFVKVGAEGVVESGGIVNKVGSYTIVLCAKELKKPFYVLTESFKFARLYSLSQQDLPDDFKMTTQFAPAVLHTITNPDDTVSIVQVDPNNPIITLPDGTTAHIQGLATIETSQGDGSVHRVQIIAEVGSQGEATLSQDGEIILTSKDGHGYPVSVSDVITVYQTMVANIQHIHTNSDGTMCVTPMVSVPKVEPSYGSDNMETLTVTPGITHQMMIPGLKE